jgi:steroid delta-isomerase-like uncharacterized protein
MMTNDDIRSFLDRFRRAWEIQDVKGLANCYADDCVVVSPIFSTLTGRHQVEKAFTDIFKAFETQLIQVEDIVIGNDDPMRVAMVWKLQSRHVGEVFGVPASGKRIERTIAFVLTLRDGRIINERRIYDFTSMLMQLGALRAKPAHG